MNKPHERQTELKPMELCDSCKGIQRNWRRAPATPSWCSAATAREDRDHGQVTFTRYQCDRCGTAWEYENDKTNLHAGWSVVGR